MLGLKGTVTLWYVSSVTNMRYGKYRLYSEVEARGLNPYNGDGYLFMSKNRRTIKIIRYKNNKRHLYDISYDGKDYRFMRPVREGGETIYELDYKYLVALLECPVVNSIYI